MHTPSQPSATATITGQVSDAQGQPIAWATVMFTGDSPPHADIAAVTDGQGRYRYTNLIPGTYTVLVNAEGYSAHTQQICAIAGQVVQLPFRLSHEL